MNLEDFSLMNALWSAVLFVVTAFASWSQYRKVKDNFLEGGLENLSKVAEAREDMVEILEKRVAALEAAQLKYVEELARCQSYNEWLVAQHVAYEHYCDTLQNVLQAKNIPIPVGRPRR